VSWEFLRLMVEPRADAPGAKRSERFFCCDGCVSFRGERGEK